MAKRAWKEVVQGLEWHVKVLFYDVCMLGEEGTNNKYFIYWIIVCEDFFPKDILCTFQRNSEKEALMTLFYMEAVNLENVHLLYIVEHPLCALHYAELGDYKEIIIV